MLVTTTTLHSLYNNTTQESVPHHIRHIDDMINIWNTHSHTITVASRQVGKTTAVAKYIDQLVATCPDIKILHIEPRLMCRESTSNLNIMRATPSTISNIKGRLFDVVIMDEIAHTNLSTSLFDEFIKVLAHIVSHIQDTPGNGIKIITTPNVGADCNMWVWMESLWCGSNMHKTAWINQTPHPNIKHNMSPEMFEREYLLTPYSTAVDNV